MLPINWRGSGGLILGGGPILARLLGGLDNVGDGRDGMEVEGAWEYVL